MSRQRYVVTLRTDSPLIVGTTQSAGNYRQTESNVSGKTWRGAIADTLRRSGEDHDKGLFNTLFLQPEMDQIHFGTLVPVQNVEDTLPPPTRFSCKRKPVEHGFFDTLVRQYALEVALTGQIPDWLDQMRCPVCGEVAEMNTELLSGDEIATLATTHTAINRLRRVAEDTLLYTEEGTLLKSAATVYAGWLDIPEQLVESLRGFLVEGRALRIGGSRSRGMGRVTIEGFEPLRFSEVLEDRVVRFNQAIRDVLHFYKDQTNSDYPELFAAEQNRFFTLNLRDEAIFLKNGLPSPDPELPDGITVVSRWITWRNVGGWHMAARLPRRTNMSVNGVYLCRFEDDIDFEKLCALERDGVGHLREQGYGQVYVCDPVHYTKLGLED